VNVPGPSHPFANSGRKDGAPSMPLELDTEARLHPRQVRLYPASVFRGELQPPAELMRQAHGQLQPHGVGFRRVKARGQPHAVVFNYHANGSVDAMDRYRDGAASAAGKAMLERVR